MSTDRFAVTPSNYLGFEYEEYKNDLYALALSKPSEYFRLRKEVVKSVKTDAIGNIYKTFTKILSEGQSLGGANMIVEIGGTVHQPKYPDQEISKIALKAARTLDDILEDVIDIILPNDFKQLANQRAVKTSNENI